MAVELYRGQNGPISQGTKFSMPNATAAAVASYPTNRPMPPMLQTAQATGANLPSPMTWLVGVIVLLIALKMLGESDKTPINPAHIHVGGYNVLTIFVIVVTSVVGMKILVNRPFFEKGPQSGLASLINAT